MRKAKWAYLLGENPDFRRWYNKLARGSEGTARERARVLYRFLRKHEMEPRSLVELARRDRRSVEDTLMDFITRLHRKGYSPGYMENYLKAVRSWLEFNEIKLVRRIKIENRNATPTIEDERVPTKRELRQIVNYAGERGRCSITLMALAGLGPQTLGNREGTDGLEIKDLPEMKIDQGVVSFTVIPTRVIVRPELSKAGHKYFTYLNSEGCEYLRAYLEKRLAMDEKLTPSSAVIAVKYGYEETGLTGENRTSRHITTKTITKEIRDAMRPKFKWRPYVLRCYFDTQLLVAENHGRISHAYRQFFLGHKGAIEARYNTNKGGLPQSVTEDMRRSFQQCEKYLSTTPASKWENPELTTIRTMVESGVLDLSKPNVRQYLVKKLGIQDLDVKIAKTGKKMSEDEAYLKAIYGELGVKPMKIPTSKPKQNSYPKKIVGEEELESYLADGWDVQTVLPSGRIMIRK